MDEEIQRLEEKIAYLEQHQVEQDKVMLELNDAIARLVKELRALRQTLADTRGGERPGPEDEARPPHY